MTPDFIIVGAMKCGTTTLAAQLAAQPGVFMSSPKEPNFFSDDNIYAQGMGWYEALFSQAAPSDLKGEASTHYTKLPTYPDTIMRMKPALDAPKFIYMIRDPLVRAVSHYVHEWSQAHISTNIATAFAQNPILTDYGRYAYQIKPYIDAFGAQSVHLTSLEQLKADPQETLSQIGSFLGTDLEWQDGVGVQNASTERVRSLPFHNFIVDNPVMRSIRRTLVPKALRTAIRESRRLNDRPVLPTDLQHRLSEIYLEDHSQLTTLFPNHPALDLCYRGLSR